MLHLLHHPTLCCYCILINPSPPFTYYNIIIIIILAPLLVLVVGFLHHNIFRVPIFLSDPFSYIHISNLVVLILLPNNSAPLVTPKGRRRD